jgi:hypothetical protein
MRVTAAMASLRFAARNMSLWAALAVVTAAAAVRSMQLLIETLTRWWIIDIPVYSVASVVKMAVVQIVTERAARTWCCVYR